MKVEIREAQPDGLLVSFKNDFWFGTWGEVIDFIKKVGKT